MAPLRVKLFYFLLEKWQSRPLFVDFRPFIITISKIQIEKSVNDVLGFRTQGRKIGGGGSKQWSYCGRPRSLYFFKLTTA